MGNTATQIVEAKPEEKKKLKPCCACPETKKARDTWYEISFLDRLYWSCARFRLEMLLVHFVLNENFQLIFQYNQNLFYFKIMSKINQRNINIYFFMKYHFIYI